MPVFVAVGQRCVIECVGVFLATASKIWVRYRPLRDEFDVAVIVSVVRVCRGICTISILFVTTVLVSSLRSIFGFRFVRKLLPSFLVNIVLFISSYLRFGQWTLIIWRTIS